ncbi:MAG TPA: hypothetical protein PKA58_31280 [Polyangium sp.]|nr:hypothetical protein [Polyangium sp.]
MSGKTSVNPLFQSDLPDSAGAVDFSPCGQFIAAATLAGPVLILEATTGKLLRQTVGHTGGALAVAYHQTNNAVVTAGQDGCIQVLRDARIQVLRNATPNSPVSHLAWSTDGSVLAAAAGRALLLYDAQGNPIGEAAHFSSTLLSLSYAEPLACFLVPCYGGVHLISPEKPPKTKPLFARTSIISVTSSPCGRFVAAGAQDPVVRVWDLHNDDECVHLEGYRGKISLLQWGREQSILATAAGSSVVLWSFASGDPHATPHVELSPHPARVLALGFSENGHSLWTGCADGTLRLFDLTASLEPVFSVNVGAPVHLLRVLPQSILVATTAGTLAAFGLSRRKPRKQKPREQPVHS